MNHKWIKINIIASVLLLALNCLIYPVFADEIPQFVYDTASILEDDEYYELNQRAAEISRKYQCAVHIIITDDPNLTMDNIQVWSEDLYLSSDSFGYGVNKDGFMLVLGTVDRCYWLLAYGDYGNYALTDYGKEVMTEDFLDDFKEDDWYGGFSDYLNQCETVLEMAAGGKPLDVYLDEESNVIGSFGIGAIIALIAAFIICEKFKKQMRTAVLAAGASNYVETSNVEINFRKDRFSHRTTTRTKIKSESNDSSGKGTTVNSRGFSGKGGKF